MSRSSRWARAIAAGLVLCLLWSVCGVEGACVGVRERVVRLHILANSDSETDQAVKLRVRDAVLAEADGLLDTVLTREEAVVRLREALPALQAAAERTVAACGFSYGVRIAWKPVEFPTRTYGTVTLPAGTYEAVQILLGEGNGHNWWCVMYPPLCLGAATDSLNRTLTAAETDLVTHPARYTVRLKVVEWWNALTRHRRN